jgi:hypothetical protein
MVVAYLRIILEVWAIRSNMRTIAYLFVLILLSPLAVACETEVERALNGWFPSPTGISPDKDESIRETNRIATIGQEVARFQLWRVLNGVELTERQIADEIDRSMIENGSNPDWPSFETIVASGPNGAIPHGDPDNRGAGPKIVEVGDVVVVDLGARVNDWVSDVTRTYIVGGTTNETIISSYMAVYDAQNLTFPVIEAGTPAWVPDDIARTHITEQGYGDLFIHSLGHGFGVCVHEPPLLSSGSSDPLFGLSYNEQPLMIYDAVTVEPGIYHPDWFGIRLEDDFLINANGHEYLTADLPRDLEWAMIMLEDYTDESVKEVEGDKDESTFLPYPAGIVEILVLTAIVVAIKREEIEEC